MRRALDLFCGGGGAARGLLAAGFDEVYGVDIADHRKAYPGVFVQGDALNPPFRLDDFDFVWASPPCQAFSQGLDCQPERRSRYPNHIPATRTLLQSSGRPWCMENVPRAPIRADVALTGAQFGLEIHRKRLFEIEGFVPPFDMSAQWLGKTVTRGDLACVAGNGTNNAWNLRRGKALKWRDLPPELTAKLKKRNCVAGWRDAMGYDHGELTRDEIKESVPPAYAEYIAREALRQMEC